VRVRRCTMSKIPRLPDTFRWRLAIGAVLIVGSYLEWLIIPLVVRSGLNPKANTALTAVIGVTNSLRLCCSTAHDQLPEKASSHAFSRKVGPAGLIWLVRRRALICVGGSMPFRLRCDLG
jgi:hypothetical protein